MKTIIYAGDKLITGDEIAAAVLRCGKVMAELGSADTVAIPYIDETGVRHTATLLVGPASQIIVEDGPEGFEELIDADAIAGLNRVADRSTSGYAPDEPYRPGWIDDL